MDRTRAIDGLAGALADAARQADWERLGHVAGELAPQLQQLAAGRPWSRVERAALQRLRGAHDEAQALVAGASARLEARLEDMRENKEGWMAYALADEPDTGSTQR